MQSFKLKFLGVTILQGVEFPIFLLIFEWVLQTVQRDCAACENGKLGQKGSCGVTWPSFWILGTP